MRHAVTRYGVSLAVVAAAVLLRRLLDPLLGDRVPFITLLPAIALVAWSCGRSAALLAIIIGSAALAFSGQGQTVDCQGVAGLKNE